MFTLGHAFNTQLDSLQLCLSLCFLPAQSIQISQEWELPEHTFSPGHMYSTTHVHSLLVSQEYVGDFQSPYGHLISHIFLWGFLVSLLFALTVVHYHRQPQIFCNVCWQTPLREKDWGEFLFSLLGKLQVRSNTEDRFSRGVFQGGTTRSIMTILWDVALKELQLPSADCQEADF